jgi:hypothetical protein
MRFPHYSYPITSLITLACSKGSWFDIVGRVGWDDRGIRVGKKKDGDGEGLLPVGTRETEEGEGGKEEGEWRRIGTSVKTQVLRINPYPSPPPTL